jgi:uncharacterized lipoprotein
MKKLSYVLLVVLLASCSSKPVLVAYQAPESDSGDWFPIPADAPSTVEVSVPTVPRIKPNLDKTEATDSAEPLSVVRLQDSIGNVSLQINRQPGVAWEIVESAINTLEIDVFDKDREQYRFELAIENKAKGLFSFFKPSDGLFIVLVPQAENTVLVIEGQDDTVPDDSRVKRILDQFTDYFEAKA